MAGIQDASTHAQDTSATAGDAFTLTGGQLKVGTQYNGSRLLKAPRTETRELKHTARRERM